MYKSTIEGGSSFVYVSLINLDASCRIIEDVLRPTARIWQVAVQTDAGSPANKLVPNHFGFSK